MHKIHLAYVFGCLAFLTFAATTTGCTSERVVTVRVPSQGEIQDKQDQVGKDANDLSKSAGDLAKLYYQRAKAAYCKD